MGRHKYWHCRAQVLRPLAASLIAALAAEAPNVSWAANLIVTNCNDSGGGSLRATVSQAASGDTVDLTRLQCSSITLTSGEIATSLSDLTLNGLGVSASNISGVGEHRVLDHTGLGTLTLNGILISEGYSGKGNGGCIYSAGNVILNTSTVGNCKATVLTGYTRGGAVYTKGNLTLTTSTIGVGHAYCLNQGAQGGGAFVSGDFTATSSSISHSNADCKAAYSGYGGGVFALGNVDIESSSILFNSADVSGGLYVIPRADHTATIVNSTIASNSARAYVGGVSTGMPLLLENSTIANNAAEYSLSGRYIQGVGLELNHTTANIQSSIIANNKSVTGVYDVGGIGSTAAILGTSQNNLIMASSLTLPANTLRSDPKLGNWTYSTVSSPYENSAPFLPLLAGSAAINAGNNVSGAHYDERGNGHARVVGNAADIGAYETQSTGVTTMVGNCADSGTGSLRDGLAKAQSGDTLDLRALDCNKITLTGELATGLGNVTLLGPGASLLTIDGNLNGRVLNHSGFGTLTLNGMTLSRGYYYQPDALSEGGCVISASTVALLNSKVTLCRALGSEQPAAGGGIFAERIIAAGSQIMGSAVSTPKGVLSEGGGLFATYLSMDESTVSDNQAIPAGHGGGIYAGIALISRSTISGNQAFIGGGLGATVINFLNSTVSANSATLIAGVFTAYGSRNLSLYNSTVAFNTSSIGLYGGTQFPAGVYASGVAHLQSSIIFGNTSNSNSYDVGGVGKVIGANNLIGTSSTLLPIDTIHSDPLLGPLQDNGGETLTHALLGKSPAIDAGNNVANLAFDQRGNGFARVSGAAPDIGAFETQDTIFANGFEQTP